MSAATLSSDRRIHERRDQNVDSLINDARVILANCGVTMGQSKLSRLVRTFKARVEGNGWQFFDFLTNAVQLDDERRREAMANPDIQRVIAYADPTGETAVANVMARR